MKHLSKDNIRSIIMLVCFFAVVLFMVVMNTSCNPPSPRYSATQVEIMKADSAAHAVAVSMEDIWTVTVEAFKGDSLVYFNQRTVVGNDKANKIVTEEESGVAKYMTPDSIHKSLRKLEIE